MAHRTETLVLHPTRRAEMGARINHLLPAVVLILSAFESITGEHHGPWWLPASAFTVGAALLVVFVRDWRTHDQTAHATVSLFDIIAAVVIFMEGVERYKPWKGFQPAWLYFGAAVVTLLIGVFHRRLIASRYLQLDESGFTFSTRFWRAQRFNWSEVAAVDTAGDAVVVTPRQGRPRRLSLRRIANREAVHDALRRWGDASRTPEPGPRVS